MADDFDPYYTWLGIRPEEQPPDHYRLIGLRQFEDNADVIANASDRQMQFLRSMQVGKRRPHSQKLLNEVSAAGGCLLDPQRKAAYDKELKSKEAAKAQAAKAAAAKAKPLPKAVSLTPIPKPDPLTAKLPEPDLFSIPMPQNAYVAPVQAAPRRSAQPGSKLPLILGGAVGGAALLIVLVVVVGRMLSGSSTTAVKLDKVQKNSVSPAVTPTEKSAGKETISKPAPAEKTTNEIAKPVSVPSVASPPREAIATTGDANPGTSPTTTAATNWTPPAAGSTRVFRSLLGNYMYSNDRGKTYPFVNLQVPRKNLWNSGVEEKVRGKVPYEEISYAGTAKIAVPSDGTYVWDAEKPGRLQIDGKVVSEWDTPKGEIKLAGGIHDLIFEIGSHGGNWMRETNLALRHKETGEEVPFFNTWQDIQKFLVTPINGQSVVEVSGWQPTEQNELKDYAQLVASAGVKRPVAPIATGPQLPTPIHSWSFDEKSGDTVADSGKGDSRGKNPLRLDRWDPAQPRFVPGRIGNALRFSQQENFAATERYVDFPQLTIAFWLNVLGEEGINPRIAHPWIELNYEYRKGVGALGMVTEPERPEVGKWHHYAVAINQSTKQVKIFKDGAEVAAGMLGEYESRQNVKYWALGHNQDQSNPNDSLHAELDEMKIYDRFLTNAEVKQLAALELAKATGAELAPGVAGGPPSVPVVKVPVPDAASQAAARAKVASIFVDELKKAKTPPQKQELAKSLLDVSATTADVPERYALLGESRRLAVEAKDAALATLALEALGNNFEIDLLAEKVKLLQGLAVGNPTPAQRNETLSAVCQTGHEALAAGNLEATTALITLARSLAAKSTTPEGKAEAKEFVDLATQRQKRMEALKKAEQTLATSPDNPAANLLVGLNTFFVRGMEKEGLAMLAKGSDAKLAAAAKARGANAAKGEATSIEEADAWHDAIATVPADFKLEVQKKALDSYTQLASSGTGLVKAKAEKRRLELAAALPAGADQPAKRLRLSDVPEKSPGMIGRVLVNGKDSGILITHLPPGEMDAGKLKDLLAAAKAQRVRLVVVGTLNCPGPSICKVFQTGTDNGPSQVLLIDGKEVSSVGANAPPGNNDVKFPLEAGDHVVQWICDFGGENSPRIDLYLDTGDGDKQVRPFCTRAQEYEARKVPFRTEIDLSPYGRNAR